jgi:signal transduction histidine kinase
MGLQRRLEVEPLHDELKRYLRFTEEDARRVAAARDTVASSFRRITEEFYDRIREHQDAHDVFTDEEQIGRLQRSLVGWLERLFGGTYDAEYFAKTEKIGTVHVRVGLPQRYVVSAMSLIRRSLASLIEAPETRDALARLLDIELAIMLESYRGDALARVERASSSTTQGGDAVADIAPIAIIGLDAGGAVTAFNGAAESLTGWARDEIRGKKLVEVIGPFATPLVTRSGKRRSMRWQIVSSGSNQFAFGIDTTDELEQRAQEEQSSRLAAAGNLVAGLAHAIRNPLNGASLHLALIERAAEPGETLEATRIARSELRRISTLVSDFLEFARPKPVVRGLIDARRIVELAIARTKANVTTDLPSQPLTLNVDGGRVEQAIVHLLSNALDAGDEGGSVVVRARREPHHVWIEVEDAGPGLADPSAPIFDAFYSTKHEGNGLGLAIVHRTAVEHGGEIDVESRPGCTRFRLRLPITEIS